MPETLGARSPQYRRAFQYSALALCTHDASRIIDHYSLRPLILLDVLRFLRMGSHRDS